MPVSGSISVSDRLWDEVASGLILPMCSSASLLSGGSAEGLRQEQNDSCLWHQGCLQRFHKDLLYLLTSWKLPVLPHLNQPSACPVQQPVLVMMQWVCAEKLYSITYKSAYTNDYKVTFIRPSYRSQMTGSIGSSSLALHIFSIQCKSIREIWPQTARILWWEQ